jgi:hypothetical protein
MRGKDTPRRRPCLLALRGLDDDGSRRMAPDYRLIGSTRRLDSWMNSRSLVVEMLACLPTKGLEMRSSPMRRAASASTALEGFVGSPGLYPIDLASLVSVQRIARFANTGPVGRCMMWHLITPNIGARAQVEQPTSDTRAARAERFRNVD